MVSFFLKDCAASLKHVRDKITISLKVIENLTYNCTSSEDLEDILQKLERLKTDFRQKLPQSRGLIIRPVLSARVRKIRRKYVQLSKRASQYASLPRPRKRVRKAHHPQVGNTSIHICELCNTWSLSPLCRCRMKQYTPLLQGGHPTAALR